MTKWLRAYTVLVEDKRLVPKHPCWVAHTGTPVALAPEVSEASGFLGHLHSTTDELIHTHKDTHTSIKSSIRKKYKLKNLEKNIYTHHFL